MEKRGFRLKEIKGKNKKAQQIFGMSFSFIVSILLIAIFIAVAFFAIRHFLNIQKCNKIGFFIDDLEQVVDDAWKSSSHSSTFSRELPSGIEQVCFADLSSGQRGSNTQVYEELMRNIDYSANLFFYPKKKACVPRTNIEHINMTELIEQENPYCFKIEGGKVEIKIEKGFYDSVVKVSR